MFTKLKLIIALSIKWDLVCDRKNLNKATATIFFVEVMFGAIIFGIFCDK